MIGYWGSMIVEARQSATAQVERLHGLAFDAKRYIDASF